MARKSPQIQISEISGDHYASIEAARIAALDDISLDLNNTIRELIASGQLVLLDGRIIPNPKR